MTFDVSDPEFEARIRTSFTRQGLNGTMGQRLDASLPEASRLRCRSAPASVSSTASFTAA